MGGHLAYLGELRNAYKILVRKPEEKRLLGRPKCRREFNIRIYLRKIGSQGIDWIHLAQNKY
jgi:hypothetical protein